MRSEARILDETIGPLRDDAAGRIMDLMSGSNDEDDNIFQVLDDVLLNAYIQGRLEKVVVIDNLEGIQEAIKKAVLEVRQNG